MPGDSEPGFRGASRGAGPWFRQGFRDHAGGWQNQHRLSRTGPFLQCPGTCVAAIENCVRRDKTVPSPQILSPSSATPNQCDPFPWTHDAHCI